MSASSTFTITFKEDVSSVNKAMSEKTEIVRVVKPISVGEEITSDMVKTIEVGSYNLPDDVVKHSDTVVGAFASADLAPGDYILTSKIAEEPAAEKGRRPGRTNESGKNYVSGNC